MSYFLGMEFTPTNRDILLHQKKNAEEVLTRLRMEKCNPAATPLEANLKLNKDENEKDVDSTLYKQIVGCVRFLCCTRPVITFGVGLINRFMESPKVTHFAATKRILR
jgi:hypothetical protein